MKKIITTHFLIILGLIVIFSLGFLIRQSPFSLAQSGWLAGWDYCREITIDPSKIDNNLPNFPVAVMLSSSNFDYTKAQEDGADIRFTQSDGETLIDFEREIHSISTDSYVYHVEIPTVSSSAAASTTFYMYYGNSGASDAAATSTVWDSNFTLVTHMKDDPDASSITDSTINNNDGTKTNVPLEVDGKIGKAQDFTGSNDYVTITATSSLNITVSMWIKMSEAMSGIALSKTIITDPWLEYRGLITNAAGDPFQCQVVNDSGTSYVSDAAGSLETDTWTHLTMTFDGSTLKQYQNGSQISTKDVSGTVRDLNAPIYFGIHRPTDQNNWNGMMDEVRISSIARSAAWIKASYNSENDSLLSYGSEQTSEPPVPCADHNVEGYAWSENIGWISFSCENTIAIGEGSDFGVDIDESTGEFSGYAWSENIGWISFNSEAVTDCPDSPCPPVVDLAGDVSGWARVCSVFTDACACGAVCSDLKPDTEKGGWEGWIRLRDTNYGAWIDSSLTPSEFRDWGWSNMVVGWLSFNRLNCDPDDDGYSDGLGSCPGTETSISDYKVIMGVSSSNNPPQANFDCDISACFPSSDCIGYIMHGSNCVLVLRNHSTDPDLSSDSLRFEWDIMGVGSDPEDSCGPTQDPSTCNFVPANFISTPGTYTTELYVEDLAGASHSFNKDIYLREEVKAGFRCSLDNSDWGTNCNDLVIGRGAIVYFKDDLPDPYEHSSPSEGAISIDHRTWRVNGGIFSGDNDPNASSTLVSSSNRIELTVEDNNERTNSITHTLTVEVPSPRWREVAPR